MKFSHIIANLSIILSLMLLVFFVLDHFNDAMAFINNAITKDIMAAASVLAIINGILVIKHYRDQY